MKSVHTVTVVTIAILAAQALGAGNPPLKLIQRVQMPGIKKSFDHLTADPKGNRLFVAAEWHSSVEVYNMKTGKCLHSIAGMRRPHAVLYREDIDRIYITDGDDDGGMVRIYDGKTYEQVKKIDLLPDWVRSSNQVSLRNQRGGRCKAFLFFPHHHRYNLGRQSW